MCVCECGASYRRDLAALVDDGDVAVTDRRHRDKAMVHGGAVVPALNRREDAG